MSIQYHQVTCSLPPTRNLSLPRAALNVTHAFATCGTGLTTWDAGNPWTILILEYTRNTYK